MKEILKTTAYSNRTPILNLTGNSAWSLLVAGEYLWYETNSGRNGSYGAFYNYQTTVDPNDLCPAGWHVTTNYD
jgi:hypothetical protein